MSGIDEHTITTVVFDLDGVLIDSFEVMRNAFAQAYHEVVGDGEPPFEQYLLYQGRWFPEIMRRMDLPAAMEAPFVRASTELVERVDVYPGVPDLLRQLHGQGVRTAVATGKAAARARHVLDVKGLLPLLDAVVGSDEVTQPKPHPDIVREALRRVDAPATDAVMIGDAAVDIRSGRAAGTATVGALWGGGEVTELAPEHPDLMMTRPAELLPLVAAPTTAAGAPDDGQLLGRIR